jgi:hypothetical protein
MKTTNVYHLVAAALGEMPGQGENARKLKCYIDTTVPHLMDHIEGLCGQQKDFFRGYIHGECWTNNFLFRYQV